MQDKRERIPDEKMGRFAIAVSVIMLFLLFLTHLDVGTKATCFAFGISGLAYGRGLVASAKKWREKYGEPTPEELTAIKKSHSVNIFRLLALIVVIVATFVLLFVAIAYCLSRFNAR